MLRFVSTNRDFYAFGGNDAARRGDGFGCARVRCAREVSTPFDFRNAVVWCLYCGIEEGHVPAVEMPFGSHQYSFGITRSETIEDRQALVEGRLESMADERARRYGHVIDLFG